LLTRAIVASAEHSAKTGAQRQPDGDPNADVSERYANAGSECYSQPDATRNSSRRVMIVAVVIHGIPSEYETKILAIPAGIRLAGALDAAQALRLAAMS
jgi:hypothetical protein